MENEDYQSFIIDEEDHTKIIKNDDVRDKFLNED
jgi:hypothetical protein